MALSLATCWAIAALSTERCSRQATTPLHMRTAAPNAPRMAPTAMNTVPSGMVDRFMNGASLTGGGDGGG